MRIYRHFNDSTQLPSALAIGNFDGFHLGHRALLETLIDQADEQQLQPSVMTFEPHPRELFMPDNAPARLSSLREKLEHFEAAGVAQVYLVRFDQAFASLSAEAFMQTVLKQQLNAKAILVGGDFRFGAKRKGTIYSFTKAGFQLIDFPEVMVNQARVSSTLVRDSLANGQLDLAQRYLGRPYSMSGKVVKGAQLGRQLGFPTANVHMRHERPALMGVYAVKLNDLPAVANLGVRPTLGGIPKLKLEVHVLDFNEDLYGQHVHVAFYHKIRDEMQFDGLDALKAQIAKDAAVAEAYFNSNS